MEMKKKIKMENYFNCCLTVNSTLSNNFIVEWETIVLVPLNGGCWMLLLSSIRPTARLTGWATPHSQVMCVEVCLIFSLRVIKPFVLLQIICIRWWRSRTWICLQFFVVFFILARLFIEEQLVLIWIASWMLCSWNSIQENMRTWVRCLY